MVHLGFETASIDLIRMNAKDLFDSSSQEVKELTYKFFRSMDVNHDGGVDWEEIQKVFSRGNLLIQPPYPLQVQHQLFVQLDQDKNGNLNFNEFIAFYYCLFLRANCNLCGENLVGKEHLTCMHCFTSAVTQSGCTTFDVCKTCCYGTSLYYTHDHPRTQFKKYQEVIFKDITAGTGSRNLSEIEPRQELFRRQFIALQSAAAVATIGTAAVAAANVVAPCAIL